MNAQETKLVEPIRPVRKKILDSQADLDPKDRAMLEMHNWCERQGNIVVLNSGPILASDPSSRAVQNCKIVMRNKGLRPGKVSIATEELITMLLANAEAEAEQQAENLGSVAVSTQQQRLRMLVREAVAAQASDIHIEVRQEVARVKFRKHGELYLHAEWSAKVGREIASVAFNKETDHAITHFNPLVPQGASMPMLIDNQEVRLRLASMPAHGGFDVVLRVLSLGDEQIFSLQELGYTERQIAIIRKATLMPHGATMIAGPTGSGKTTTLASCMRWINKTQKIYTIEDPVEKLIINATQVPINVEKEDRSFANMGKAALRMDPDVIVLGEMRDEPTARVLIRAAITGHLVFSTIHTNSATNIVTRLTDMGISPVLLGDNNLLTCLMFQRLVPKLCQYCAQSIKKIKLDTEIKQRWQTYFLEQFSNLQVRGTHCSVCRNTGVAGRTVVAEVIWIDEEGRRFIQQSDTLSWEQYLREHGWQTYKDHTLDLVRQGVVDPFDAEKIIGEISSKFSRPVFEY